MDAETVRTIAKLARSRAARSGMSHRDGMERLGAQRALDQLAVDLEISADALERKPGPKRRLG